VLQVGSDDYLGRALVHLRPQVRTGAAGGLLLQQLCSSSAARRSLCRARLGPLAPSRSRLFAQDCMDVPLELDATVETHTSKNGSLKLSVGHACTPPGLHHLACTPHAAARPPQRPATCRWL
jgi:hypothetical protein